MDGERARHYFYHVDGQRCVEGAEEGSFPGRSSLRGAKRCEEKICEIFR